MEKARNELIAQGKGTEANRRSLAETLINEGIYPSLGEREKAIFTTSPVSECKFESRPIVATPKNHADEKKKPAKMQELANYRSLDAALAGTSTKPKSQLIEERDIVGADIAV